MQGSYLCSLKRDAPFPASVMTGVMRILRSELDAMEPEERDRMIAALVHPAAKRHHPCKLAASKTVRASSVESQQYQRIAGSVRAVCLCLACASTESYAYRRHTGAFAERSNAARY